MKARLSLEGVRCAWDIDHRIHRISGIGPSKADALKDWRRQVEQQAVASVPGPTSAEEEGITIKFVRQRQHLKTQIHAADGIVRRERQEVMNRFIRERAQLDQAEVDAKRQHDTYADRARRSHEQRAAEVTQKFQRLKDPAEAQRLQLSERINRVQQSIFAEQFELCKMERELERYRNVSFRRYVARVLWLPRWG